MAVIWVEEDGLRYVTPGGWPPSSDDIQLANEFDKILIEEFNRIESRLAEKGFFELNPDIWKWYLLGLELQFLDTLDIVKKCDPDLENIWRHLYDLVPNLAPTQSIPKTERVAKGVRNHFYMTYRLARIPWETLQKFSWTTWKEMFFSFNPEMWNDYERLIEWLIIKMSSSERPQRIIMRDAVKAMRHIAGKQSESKKEIRMLSNKELFEMLDSQYDLIINT